MMENKILGIHHVTAIAGDAQTNYHFYTHVLGLRLVKKTVNFDDPETYHFYYGNKQGSAGTILTFFPWGDRVRKGIRGTQQITEVALSVPRGSLSFWKDRLENEKIIFNNVGQKFGESYLTFLDPDGLKIELTESKKEDQRQAWTGGTIGQEHAILGIHHVTITTETSAETAQILTEVFGYKMVAQEVNRFRFEVDTVDQAATVDLVEVPGEQVGHVAGGSVHHVAFRVKTVADLMEYRSRIVARGLHITEKMDRNYFYSLYFREPGGVLFEIASDEPGFLIDETIEELGSELKLPEQFEGYRDRLEKVLPKLV